jgi:hypothetical protein
MTCLALLAARQAVVYDSETARTVVVVEPA